MGLFNKKPNYSILSDEELLSVMNNYVGKTLFDEDGNETGVVPLDIEEDKELVHYIAEEMRNTPLNGVVKTVVVNAMEKYIDEHPIEEQDDSEETNMAENETTETTAKETSKKTKKKVDWKKVGKFCLKFVLPVLGGFGLGFGTAVVVDKVSTKKSSAKKPASKPVVLDAKKPAAPAAKK